MGVESSGLCDGVLTDHIGSRQYYLADRLISLEDISQAETEVGELQMVIDLMSTGMHHFS